MLRRTPSRDFEEDMVRIKAPRNGRALSVTRFRLPLRGFRSKAQPKNFPSVSVLPPVAEEMREQIEVVDISNETRDSNEDTKRTASRTKEVSIADERRTEISDRSRDIRDGVEHSKHPESKRNKAPTGRKKDEIVESKFDIEKSNNKIKVKCQVSKITKKVEDQSVDESIDSGVTLISYDSLMHSKNAPVSKDIKTPDIAKTNSTDKSKNTEDKTGKFQAQSDPKEGPKDSGESTQSGEGNNTWLAAVKNITLKPDISSISVDSVKGEGKLTDEPSQSTSSTSYTREIEAKARSWLSAFMVNSTAKSTNNSSEAEVDSWLASPSSRDNQNGQEPPISDFVDLNDPVVRARVIRLYDLLRTPQNQEEVTEPAESRIASDGSTAPCTVLVETVSNDSDGVVDVTPSAADDGAQNSGAVETAAEENEDSTPKRGFDLGYLMACACFDPKALCQSQATGRRVISATFVETLRQSLTCGRLETRDSTSEEILENISDIIMKSDDTVKSAMQLGFQDRIAETRLTLEDEESVTDLLSTQPRFLRKIQWLQYLREKEDDLSQENKDTTADSTEADQESSLQVENKDGVPNIETVTTAIDAIAVDTKTYSCFSESDMALAKQSSMKESSGYMSYDSDDLSGSGSYEHSLMHHSRRRSRRHRRRRRRMRKYRKRYSNESRSDSRRLPVKAISVSFQAENNFNSAKEDQQAGGFRTEIFSQGSMSSASQTTNLQARSFSEYSKEPNLIEKFLDKVGDKLYGPPKTHDFVDAESCALSVRSAESGQSGLEHSGFILKEETMNGLKKNSPPLRRTLSDTTGAARKSKSKSVGQKINTYEKSHKSVSASNSVSCQSLPDARHVREKVLIQLIKEKLASVSHNDTNTVDCESQMSNDSEETNSVASSSVDVSARSESEHGSHQGSAMMSLVESRDPESALHLSFDEHSYMSGLYNYSFHESDLGFEVEIDAISHLTDDFSSANDTKKKLRKLNLSFLSKTTSTSTERLEDEIGLSYSEIESLDPAEAEEILALLLESGSFIEAALEQEQQKATPKIAAESVDLVRARSVDITKAKRKESTSTSSKSSDGRRFGLPPRNSKANRQKITNAQSRNIRTYFADDDNSVSAQSNPF